MANESYRMGAPQGSAPPPPPMWMPMPVQATAARRPLPWAMLCLLSQLLGFVLIFIGTLLVIVGASIWGGCVTDPTSCGTSWLSGVLNYIVTSKILWALGLLFLGGGSGLKLHFVLQPQAQSKPEDLQYLATERRANYLTLLISILLMAALLLVTISMASAIPGLP
jgi:hypothetical protein